MDLIIISINALLYLALLYFHWRHVKSVNSTSVVLLVYVFIAIFGIFRFPVSGVSGVYRMWPYLYLFFCIFLFFKPILFNTNKIYEAINVKASHVNFFLILCIVSGLFVVYYFSKDFFSIILKAEFGDLRENIYSGNVEYNYSSQFERYVKLIYTYSFPIALLSVFYKLTRNNKPKLFIFLLLLIILPKLMFTILIASRGDIITLSINVIAIYLIFNKGITNQSKKTLKRFSFISAVLLGTYFFIVTVQRFGSSDASSSLVTYLALPMLNFNYGLTDSITNYANGDYFFGWLRGIDNIRFDAICGTHIGSGFVTFIGQHYMDFGPYVTLLISIVIPSLISLIIKNRISYGIAELYVFSFYINYLITGAFWTTQNVQAWIMAIFTYLFLKVLTKVQMNMN